MFKIKYGYKLQLQIFEIMKLFGSTEKLIDKTKNGENVPSLGVVEVVSQQTFVIRRHLQDVFKTSWSRRIYSP